MRLAGIYVNEMNDYIGRTAELLVIKGSEFGTSRLDVHVELRGGSCAVRSVNETAITCVLSNLVVGPLYARVFILDEDSGDPVQIRTVVSAPLITPSSTVITQDTTILVIHGQGFDPNTALNTVTLYLGLQSLACNVINASTTELVCVMQEELTSFGTLMAEVRAFSAPSERIAVAEVTLPIWALTLVLISAAGCTLLIIFLGVRY